MITPTDHPTATLTLYATPRVGNKKKFCGLRLDGSRLLVTEGEGHSFLDLGPAEALAAPYVRVLDKRSEASVRALAFLAANSLLTVQLGPLCLAGRQHGVDSLTLQVAFLPGILPATATSQEVSACVAAVVGPLLSAASQERAGRHSERLAVQHGQEAPALGPDACIAQVREVLSTAGVEVDGGAQPSGQKGPGEAGPSSVQGVGALEGELPEPHALRDQLFGAVLPSDWQREEREPPGLHCTLYRYQRRALAWMLWRESFSGRGSAAAGDMDSIKSSLPETSLLWQRLDLPSGHSMFWHPLRGQLSSAPLAPPIPQSPGGLLCDEMGLGKTVEIIALVLANPARSSEASSPGGWAKDLSQLETAGGAAVAARDKSLPSPVAATSCPSVGGAGPSQGGSQGRGEEVCGGTLVICPPTLLQQWRAELSNHAHGSLRVEVYDGLAALHPPDNSRKKPAQREMELFERILSGGELSPSFDQEAEARQAVHTLRQADVVLTTFDVLRREVYYSPNERSAGLRHAKRYAVPTCPLIQVRWWRLVVDEAQLVGPVSASATMMERIQAQHRWCVTGTPITSHGLSDVRSLLHILGHPFADPSTWNHMIGNPYAVGDPACWPLVLSLLRPLLWRNTKQEVAEEHQLPQRTLRLARLAFQGGEREIYDQILESMRATREELRLEEEGQQAELGNGPGSPSTPAASGRKRRRGEKLREDAANRILQLRLACIHPQLTKHWQQLSSDLQLNVGGTLSMEEIMGRLVDKAQYELQEVERSLCAHLNTLAMVLLGPGGGGHKGKKSKGAGSAAGVEEGSRGGGGEAEGSRGRHQREGEEGEPGPSSTKKRRRSGQPAAEAQQEALQLLEQSYRVGEKGIDALDTPLDQIQDLDDITAAGGTIMAWRRLQLNTEHQLARLYQALGREEEAAKMRADMQEKSQNVKEHADLELGQARAKQGAVQKQVEEAGALFMSSWQEAARLGFPVGTWGATGRDAADWLARLMRVYGEAQQQEAEEREMQAGHTKHILGEQVHKALGEFEKHTQGELGVLERYVDSEHLGEGITLVHGAMRGLAGASLEQLERACSLLQQQIRLLPAFKRKTLQAQWFWLLPPDQPPAQRQQGEGEAAGGLGAAGAAGPRQQHSLTLPGATGQTADAAAASDRAERHLAVQEAARAGGSFIAAERFVGAVEGFAFKLHDQGLGYYRDCPPETAPLLTPDAVMQCASQVLKALGDHHKKLEKMRGPEAAQLDGCSLRSIESKLVSVQQQMRLLRLLKDSHVAECGVILKCAIQADLEADLQSAAEDAPLPLSSPDALRKRIKQLQQDAKAVRAKKRYMASRLEEAHQLAAKQPAAAVDTAAGAGGQAGGVVHSGAPPAAAGVAVSEREQREGQAAGGSGDPWEPAVQQPDSCGGGPSTGSPPGKGKGEGPSSPAPAPPPAAVSPAPPGPAGCQPLECPVCLAAISEDIMVFGACGHSFCRDCAPKLVLERGECAVCRTKVTAKQVYRVAAAGVGAAAMDCDPDSGETAQEQVVGAWSIKVQAVLRRILSMTRSQPQEKCLVFSQFPDALKLLGRALDVNGVRYVQLAGSKQAVREALRTFNEDEEARVFLLSHRAGSTGLTLVRANHVFLLEPALEPAIEQQAVARVHRIGQMRPVHVHRLLVRGSIEEQVIKIQESKHSLFAGDSSDVMTVSHPVKNEMMGWVEVQTIIDALL